MDDNIHKKHRERLKKEFADGGFNTFTPTHKWLELLLFYCVPRIDTNPLAHELINKYKTLYGVLQAPTSELIEFNGLTESNVWLLKMIIPIARICENEKSDELLSSVNPDNINDFICAKFYGLENEQFAVACLNPMGKIIDFKFLGIGSINEIGVSSRDVVKHILQTNASCVVIAHNHPFGCALPSNEDINTTKELNNILKSINVRLLDHIIISCGDYVSLAQSSEYNYIFE